MPIYEDEAGQPHDFTNAFIGSADRVVRGGTGGLTRASLADARGLADEPTVLLKVKRDDAFLSVGVRRVLYLVSLAGLFVGPILAVSMPEYGTAIITSSNGLGAVALGVAIGNARP